MKQIESREKVALCISSILFFLQIIPLLYIGRYNHPTSDDFLYGAASHTAWVNSGSLWQTMIAAAKGVAEDYYRWQGSFTSLFFMRLQPSVFGERCYALVPWIMIGILTIGTLVFVRTLFKVCLKSDSWHFLSVSVLILTLCIQFAPVASEQFYWFNSSIYYNFYHGLLLIYLSILIRFLADNREKGSAITVFRIIGMALLGFVIGGGNYITCLTLAILMFLAIVVGICGMRGNVALASAKKKTIVIVLLWVEFLVCFGISALAPGNAVRAQTTAGFGPVKSVIMSLIQGIRYYEAWLNKWWLLVAVLLIPIFWKIIRTTGYTYPYPILVVIVLYGIFSAMGCPTYYALGNTGPGRIINIIYDAFLMISYIQLFYLLGWVQKNWTKIEDNPVTESVSDSKDSQSRNESAPRDKRNVYCMWTWGITVLFLVLMLLISEKWENASTFQAINALRKGEASQYHAEYMERLAVLEDESISDAVFVHYSVKPALVYIADGTEDPDFPNNREWADYYGKNTLTIIRE